MATRKKQVATAAADFEIIALSPQDTEHVGLLEQQSTGWTDAAKRLEVVDHPSREIAIREAQSCAATKKSIEEFFKPIKRKIDAVKKDVLDLERKVLREPIESRAIYVKKVEDFDAADAARAAAEQAAINAAHEAELSAHAQQVDASLADLSEDAAILGESLGLAVAPPPPPAPPAVVSTEAPKVDGFYYVDEWTVEIDDKMALLREVLDGRAPATIISFELGDMKKLAALHGGLTWNGVTATCKKVPRVVAS